MYEDNMPNREYMPYREDSANRVYVSNKEGIPNRGYISARPDSNAKLQVSSVTSNNPNGVSNATNKNPNVSGVSNVRNNNPGSGVAGATNTNPNPNGVAGAMNISSNPYGVSGAANSNPNMYGVAGATDNPNVSGVEDAANKASDMRKDCIPQETTITNVKLAHAYVPFQKYCGVSAPMSSLVEGTAFPELSLPYYATMNAK